LDPFCSELESKRGFASAMDFFAVIESALRHDEGLGVEEHRDALARLYSSFSEIAARNPHAWRSEAFAPDVIRNPTEKNTMQAFPYTKLHCSNWNVNQAVALIVCSVAKAEELRLRREGWIFPLSCAQSRHVVVLAQQRRLHSHPGTVAAAERAFALAETSRNDVTAAELYSCFPSAIRSFAHDVGLDASCPLTVTGAMAFAGGPFNHASLAGVARMVEVLRTESTAEARAKRVGLVTNLSAIFGKQACMVLSNAPNELGYRSDDVTDAVAAEDRPVPLDPDYAGPATIVGYTVVFDGAAMSHALAICDTPAGKRTVVRSEDKSLLVSMTREEFCGRRVLVGSDGTFSAA
jgi:acetyl-CoA C-acetyltransferase